jgi:carboxylate-amine ligase
MVPYPIPLDIGIEEEYQIIDPQTRELTSYVQQFLDQGRVLGDRVRGEFLQSQVEIGTKICYNIGEAREEIRHVRRTMVDIADSQGLWLAAAGTHPFSSWQNQVIRESERYVEFVDDMQQVVRNLLIFGMHVHIGFGSSSEQRELMITVMNQVRYFIPHILALSTSSPFWLGENTGLKSYRNIVFESMPRTGLPMEFRSWLEYENFINVLASVGALGRDVAHAADATRIWWDIRPHPRYNTLEFRVCDMATTLDEVICLAAIFQGIVAKIVRLRQQNLSWRIYRRDLIRENKWRAVRYGVEGKLIDFGKVREVPFPILVDELIELLDDVVDDLGSRTAVEYARVIARDGTSADRQLRVFHGALKNGATRQEALIEVVDHLVRETRSGL